MKEKIPWKFLAICWAFCTIYIAALQCSASDIAYFVHYENMYLLAFLCSGFLAFHFYRTRGENKHRKLAKWLSYAILTLAYPTVFLITRTIWPFTYTPGSTSINTLLNYLLFLFVVICFVVGGEIFFFLLGKWNAVCRKSMTLKLTQTLSLIVLALPMLLVIGSLIVNAIINRSETIYAYTPPVTFLGKFFTSIATQLFPLTGLTAGAGIAAVVLALPFVFLLSWVIAKQYTRRLSHLVASVNLMKTGDLQVRVNLDGEDEISRLSADFNEMAEALEITQHELLQKQEKIIAVLASQKEWLFKISHELRTPVTTIKAILESTTSADLDEITQRTAILQQEVDGLHRLIEDLFTLTQSEHAQLSLQYESFLIPDQLVAMITPLQHYAWEEKRIELVMDIPPEPLHFWVDPVRLSQVLRNLITNAVCYTPQGGVIHVQAARSKDCFLLTIQDSGEGIPEAWIENIWEPFLKHPRSKGAGIGLTLSRELIESMGGTITVESDSGCGACFKISLPVQEADHEPNKTKVDPAASLAHPLDEH
jgi:signal transduction histidine kinase